MAAQSTKAVADQHVSLCREGRNLEAIEKLYSPAIVSIEPVAMPNLPAVLNGIDAVRQKNEWWAANHEVHSAKVSGPFVGDDQFAVRFVFDITSKIIGQRFQNTEMALYTVKDGKMVREEFFYHAPGA